MAIFLLIFWIAQAQEEEGEQLTYLPPPPILEELDISCLSKENSLVVICDYTPDGEMVCKGL